jgi:hypothetical protein
VFAGAAHALSVEIVLPDTNPAEIDRYHRTAFEAVCRDARGTDLTEKASFTWDFGDRTEPVVGNPAGHRFDEHGRFRVSVTATLGNLIGTDEITVIVSETILPRAGPEDFEFYARAGTHTFCSAVCDQVQLVVNQIPDHVMPYEWYVVRFYRYEDGVWVQKQSGGLTWNAELGLHAIHEWDTSVDPNESVQWRAELELDEVGMWPPEIIVLNLYDTWTPDNTVVKAAGPDLILHDAADTSHTISWNLTHYEDGPIQPTFTVTVTIRDLAGNLVATLTSENETVGAGSVDWDENLPAASGIYTYRIVAEHGEDPVPVFGCDDSDKSPRLTIDDVRTIEGTGFSYMQFDPGEQELEYGIRYELNRDGAAGGSWLRVYDRHLNLVHVKQASHTAGTNSVLGEFQTNPAVTGAYHFVISAVETDADGMLNRDRVAKLALHKGVIWSVYPRISLHRDSQDALWPQNLEATVGVWHDETRYIPRVENSLPGYRSAVIDSWENDAVWHVFGHGGGGAAQIGRNWPSEPTTRYLVQKRWDQPGTISRDFVWGSDVAVDTEDSYPNLLLVTLQTCWSAYDASDIGSAMAGGQDAGAAASLGFNGLIGGGSVGAAWVHAFYAYAMDPQEPGRSVAEAANHAAQEVLDTFGSYYGYETVDFAGDSGISLLDGGAKWGN